MRHNETLRYFEIRYCPVCKADITMIGFDYWSDEGEYEDRYRCLNCLHLFTEKLEPVTGIKTVKINKTDRGENGRAQEPR